MAATGRLYLLSSAIERDAAFPDGVPDGLRCAVTGVGLIDAAVETARLCALDPPDEVVFLGTCGAHRESGLAIGDIIVASEVAMGSGDVARGWMRLPSLLVARLATDAGLNARLRDRYAAAGIEARPATVSCTLGVTETDELAGALNRYDRSDVENLEAFSVLRAAGDIPAAVVLGVTNIVGAGGGADWRANYRRMMSMVARALAGDRLDGPSLES